MTRNESLALLHQWADFPDKVTYRPYLTTHAAAAYDHGLAAVRAIRTAQHPTLDGFTDWYGPRTAPKSSADVAMELAAIVPYVVAESRLAFRAALAACGIPPTRNGHHNL